MLYWKLSCIFHFHLIRNSNTAPISFYYCVNCSLVNRWQVKFYVTTSFAWCRRICFHFLLLFENTHFNTHGARCAKRRLHAHTPYYQWSLRTDTRMRQINEIISRHSHTHTDERQKPVASKCRKRCDPTKADSRLFIWQLRLRLLRGRVNFFFPYSFENFNSILVDFCPELVCVWMYVYGIRSLALWACRKRNVHISFSLNAVLRCPHYKNVSDTVETVCVTHLTVLKTFSTRTIRRE